MAETQEIQIVKNIGFNIDSPVTNQNKLSKVGQRNLQFVANPLYADMHFYIKDHDITIPAHRMIVAAASPVMHQIITGSGILPGSDRITVRDITKESFLKVLHFVYSDMVQITEEEALSVLQVAHYLDLTDLVEIAVQQISNTINIYNVCSIFSSTHQLSTDLANKCIPLIQAKTEWLLDNYDLFNMNDDAIFEILKLDSLNIKNESQVFRTLLAWAHMKCLMNELPTTPKKLREIMGSRLSMVRMTAMDVDAFLECVKLAPDFFTDDETDHIRLNIENAEQPLNLLRFHSNVPRTRIEPKIKTTNLFHWRSNGIKQRDFPPEKFSIKSLAPVLIYGFGVYGKKDLSICDEDNTTIALKEVIYDEASELSKLMLEQPRLVVPGEQPHFIVHHDPDYDAYFYFMYTEYKERTNVIFGYTRKSCSDKCARTVAIYFEDLS